MRKYTGVVLDANGRPQVGASVLIAHTGTVNAANLFTDNNIALANPLTTDVKGRFSFRIFSGVYDFIDADGLLIQSEVQIFDFQNPQEWLSSAQLDFSGRINYEELTGTKDGVNTIFSLAFDPNPLHVSIFYNGVLQKPVSVSPGFGEYVLAGKNITFGFSPSALDNLVGQYWRIL